MEQYRVYVHTRYGRCTVVFDKILRGYQDKTTKDHQHKRRLLMHQSCPGVVFDDNTDVMLSQHVFLTNDRDKERCFDLLSIKLEADGHKIIRCPSDADTEIVGAAIDLDGSGKRVTVIADDTDIFVMLV